MGLERIIESTTNLIQLNAGNTAVNIPAIFTDETPDPDGDFGSNRAKRYSLRSIDDIDTDFSGNGVTKQAANAIANQASGLGAPSAFYVVKRDAVVAGVVDLVFDGPVLTGQTVSGTVNGNAISVPFDTDMAGTLSDLAAAIQALEMVDTAVSDGTDTVTITFEDEWAPAVGVFTVTGPGTAPEVETTVTTPAYTLADDIAAAIAETETNLWFAILPTTTNKGAILAAAAGIQARIDRKIQVAHSTDTAIYAVGSTDLASLLKALGYNKTMLFYHDDSTEMLHAALTSLWLANPPGSIAPSNKSPIGVTPAPLTDAQIAILEGKNCNAFTSVGIGNVVLPGIVSDGTDADAIRDVFYFLNVLDLRLFNRLTTSLKLPYNREGAQILTGDGDAVIAQNLTAPTTVLDPEYANTWTVADPATLSDTDRANKVFVCEFDGKHLASGRKIRYTANVAV